MENATFFISFKLCCLIQLHILQGQNQSPAIPQSSPPPDIQLTRYYDYLLSRWVTRLYLQNLNLAFSFIWFVEIFPFTPPQLCYISSTYVCVQNKMGGFVYLLSLSSSLEISKLSSLIWDKGSLHIVYFSCKMNIRVFLLSFCIRSESHEELWKMEKSKPYPERISPRWGKKQAFFFFFLIH